MNLCHYQGPVLRTALGTSFCCASDTSSLDIFATVLISILAFSGTTLLRGVKKRVPLARCRLVLAILCCVWWTWKASSQPRFLDQFPLRLSTKYFDFRYKRNTKQIKSTAQFADGFITIVNRDFFKAEFDYPIRVLVLEDRPAFQRFLRQQLAVDDPPNFGIYFPPIKMFVTYEDSGLGTFAHEIMHPLVEKNLRDRPLWANEGIPTFFEKFYGHWQGTNLVAQWGYQNPWRIDMLGTNLVRLDLNHIVKSPNPLGDFHESDLRMVSMFLWRQGKFQKFLGLVQRREKSGYPSYLEAAMDQPLEKIVPLWKAYLADVERQRPEILLLPNSTVLADEPGFRLFMKTYKIGNPEGPEKVDRR